MPRGRRPALPKKGEDDDKGARCEFYQQALRFLLPKDCTEYRVMHRTLEYIKDTEDPDGNARYYMTAVRASDSLVSLVGQSIDIIEKYD